MKRNPVQYDPAMKNGYIRLPYELEEGDRINAQVLEPVLFRNENGPTIGVTTCGVIVQDGLPKWPGRGIRSGLCGEAPAKAAFSPTDFALFSIKFFLFLWETA